MEENEFIGRVIGKIGYESLIDQAAEECVELAHALLKLSRHKRGVNPTRSEMPDILRNVLEEVADVTLLLRMLEKIGLYSIDDVDETIDRKVSRWINTICKKEN